MSRMMSLALGNQEGNHGLDDTDGTDDRSLALGNQEGNHGRFVDEPPRSRNESLARLMRRMGICEERGSGIDRVLDTLERDFLPAPEFRQTTQNTVAILFDSVQLERLTKKDRIRLCYYHACLRCVSNDMLSNESLRARLQSSDPSKASRIIRETLEAELIRPHDPDSKSRKHARYLPFWA